MYNYQVPWFFCLYWLNHVYVVCGSTLRYFQKMAVQLLLVWWRKRKLEREPSVLHKWSLSLIAVTLGELMDFIIESQICDSFPTENLCHWHHSLQWKACHLFHNACMPKRLCVNQIFILGDSSNLSFFTYTIEVGGIKFYFKLTREELFYLKRHAVNFFYSCNTGPLIDLFWKFGFSSIRLHWIHLWKSNSGFRESLSARNIKVVIS